MTRRLWGLVACLFLLLTGTVPVAAQPDQEIVRAGPAYAGGIGDNLLHPGRQAGIPGLALLITVLIFVLGGLVLGAVFYRSRDRYFVDVAPGQVPKRRYRAPQKRRVFGQPESAEARLVPPEGVSAALCRVIVSKGADRSSAAAVMTSLAARGRLAIAETADGYLLTRASTSLAGLVDYERRIVSAVPAKGVLLSARGLEDRFELRAALGSLRAALLRDAIGRAWFTRNPRWNRFRPLGVVLLLLSIGPQVWLANRGLLWWWIPFALTVLALTLVPGRWVTGRSAVGSAVLAQVLAFQRYLKTVEAEQIAEKKRHEVYSHYLPYAQAFNLAEHWTHKFIAAGMSIPLAWYLADIGRPHWIDGFLSFVDAVESSAPSSISVGSDTATSGWSGDDSGGGDGGRGEAGGGGGADSW